MTHLILSILCSSAVMIIFKIAGRLRIGIFHMIVINYAVAAALGLVLKSGSGFWYGPGLGQAPMLPFSIMIGLLFILVFFVIGLSTQKTGITVTTISTRMAVVIPILFSISYYNEPLSAAKGIGILLALTALVCTMIKDRPGKRSGRYAYLPIILFVGMGMVHVVIKFAQQEYIGNQQSAGFTGACFFFAFITGTLISLARREHLARFFKPKVFWMGILLGSCNFGTIFFLINALNAGIFDSSIIFGINATGVVGLSVLTAFILFKERLSRLNWLGVALSIIAIVLFTNT